MSDEKPCEIVFILYEVEFVSQPLHKDLCEQVLEKLKLKGIDMAYFRECEDG